MKLSLSPEQHRQLEKLRPKLEAGWMPIETAPKDGTEILIRIHHGNRQYCEAWERTAWEANAKARWTGGGWCWLGMNGNPVMWKPLE